MSQAGGVAFPEGRSLEKATGGCRDTREDAAGIGGSNRVACNFEMDSVPPTTPDLLSPLSLSSSPLLSPDPHRVWLLVLLFLFVPFFARDPWGGSTPFPSAVARVRVRGQASEKKKERQRGICETGKRGTNVGASHGKAEAESRASARTDFL